MRPVGLVTLVELDGGVSLENENILPKTLEAYESKIHRENPTLWDKQTIDIPL